MSKITKMGIATAQSALKNANIVIPDAIITGTGMGAHLTLILILRENYLRY